MRKLHVVLATGLAALMSASLAPIASAAPAAPDPAITEGVEGSAGVTQEEIEQVARDLKVLFTDVFIHQGNGVYGLDRAGAERVLGEQGAAQVVAAAQQATALRWSSVIGARSFGQCVLDFAGFGVLFGAAEGTIIGYINARQFEQAARAIIGAVGRSAVRGGAVGLAASLAAGATWCALPWSS